MQENVSQRGASFPNSAIRKLNPFADAASKQGKKIYRLNIGQPDIVTPPEFWDALHSIEDKVVAYENSKGLESLRVALAEEYNEKYGLSLIPQHVQITNGGSEALIFAFFSICDYGDECLIYDPTYVSYKLFAKMVGIKLVPLPLSIDDGFHAPSVNAFEDLITEKTKAILLTNPSNPTGSLLTEQEVQDALALAKKHNLTIIADEVYREFVYDGQKLSTFLTYADDYPNIIMVDSFSKRYSLCGARLGIFISKNEKILGSALKLAQARLSATCLEQKAVVKMMKTISPSYITQMVAEYKDRRDTLYESLQKIEGVYCHRPEGAFYSIVRLPVDNAEDFARWMLEKFEYNGATTFLAPAEGFYVTEGMGRDEVRIAYILNSEDLKKAIEVVGEGLKVYKK